MATATTHAGPDITGSRQPDLYASLIVTYVLAFIAVFLRFWSRKLMNAKYYIDDWCAAAALLVATGLLASTVVWIKQGYGLHFQVLGPEFLTNFFKNLFTGEILYTLVICLVKFSILAFYWRLFGGVRSIRTGIIILGSITLAWGVSVILVSIFQCQPIHGFWDKTIPSKCINDFAFFIGIAVPNIVTDWALLALPLPSIWALHQKKEQKIALTGIFMLGGFVCVISIVRLHTLVTTSTTSPDVDWNFAQVGIWTITESNIAIVSACLPSLRPMLSYILTGTVNTGHPLRYPTLKFSWTSGSKTAYAQSSSGQNSNADSQGGFAKLTDIGNPLYNKTQTVTIHAAAAIRGEPDLEMQTQKPNTKAINVQTDQSVEWDSSR